MPKLRRMFSSVSAPFWWPTNTARRPSKRQKPPTTAGSSRNSRSPCSSTTSVAIAFTSSTVCGRLTLRAMRTRSQTAVRSASGSTTELCSCSFIATSTMYGLAANQVVEQRRRPNDRPRAVAVAARLVEGGRAQVAQKPLDPVAQFVARHNLVHEAMLEQKLGALETVGQLLGDRARRDARAGEADQRLGLGEIHIAESGERGENPARGRVGHQADVRNSCLGQASERSTRLGQLHQ